MKPGESSGESRPEPLIGAAPRRAVAVIATGDELVRGTVVDTNSGWIARRLADVGFETTRFVVLGDDEEGLRAAITDLARDHGAVLITGGLGPTLDDVTRHACAAALGVELVRDATVVEHLRALFASRGRELPLSNERQALFPRGAEVLENPLGTAPGFALMLEVARNRALVCALPGPPREMQVMLESHVIPRLVRHAPGGDAFERRSFYLFGLSESAFADACGDGGSWMDREANPLIGVTAHHGVLSVSLRARAATPEAARAIADARANAIRERFAAWIFSETDPDPAQALGLELLARNVRVTVAESCTGGLVAEKLTQVPGISAVFDMGFVTYANRAKVEMLGVDSALIASHGAVSSEVAAAMARGAAAVANAALAVSVTGIAGPSGGTAEKPVGLVWFGIAHDGVVRTEERRFVVRGRELIRAFAANTALDLLRRELIARTSAD